MASTIGYYPAINTGLCLLILLSLFFVFHRINRTDKLRLELQILKLRIDVMEKNGHHGAD